MIVWTYLVIHLASIFVSLLLVGLTGAGEDLDIDDWMVAGLLITFLGPCIFLILLGALVVRFGGWLRGKR